MVNRHRPSIGQSKNEWLERFSVKCFADAFKVHRIVSRVPKFADLCILQRRALQRNKKPLSGMAYLTGVYQFNLVVAGSDEENPHPVPLPEGEGVSRRPLICRL